MLPSMDGYRTVLSMHEPSKQFPSLEKATLVTGCPRQSRRISPFRTSKTLMLPSTHPASTSDSRTDNDVTLSLKQPTVWIASVDLQAKNQNQNQNQFYSRVDVKNAETTLGHDWRQESR